MKDFLFALGRAAHPMLQRVKTPLLEHLRDVPSVTQITVYITLTPPDSLVFC